MKFFGYFLKNEYTFTKGWRLLSSTTSTTYTFKLDRTFYSLQYTFHKWICTLLHIFLLCFQYFSIFYQSEFLSFFKFFLSVMNFLVFFFIFLIVFYHNVFIIVEWILSSLPNFWPVLQKKFFWGECNYGIMNPPITVKVIPLFYGQFTLTPANVFFS